MADDNLLATEYWKRPDLNTKRRGDKEPSAIYLAVGQALSQWEATEDALGVLIQNMTQTKDGKNYIIIQRMFGVIESSSQRTKLISAVAEVYYDKWWERPEISKDVGRLINAINTASHRRNDIAHGMAIDFSKVGVFLVAPRYMVARQRGMFEAAADDDPLQSVRSEYRYTANDIQEFRQRFHRLHDYIITYTINCAVDQFGIPGDVATLIAEDSEKAASARQTRVKDRKATPPQKP